MFLQSCHIPLLQPNSRELKWAQSYERQQIVLLLCTKCREVWLGGPALYKLFQGCRFRLRAGAASAKRKWWQSKVTDRSARNTKAKNQSPSSPANCSRPVPPSSWKQWRGASAARQHQRALSSQAPHSLSCRAELPPCLLHITAAWTAALTSTLLTPLERTLPAT